MKRGVCGEPKTVNGKLYTSMDFLDPKKKRAHLIRLYIGYALMAVVLTIGTFVLVFAAYGYDIDRKTGSIIQNGLIIVDAHPEPATILVNNEEKGRTNNRLVLPAGQYDIQLREDGYRTWQHTVQLEGGNIEQLVYPFLFPANPATKELQELATSPSMASASPDRRWLVVHADTSPGAFLLMDLVAKENTRTTITLPSDTVTTAEGPHAYEVVEWSTDNTHVLLKHKFSSGQEFILLNRETPASSINLNKLFPDQPFTGVSLRDKKADQFYLFHAPDGRLYTAEVRNATVNLILTKVAQYKPYRDDTLLYVTIPAADAKLAEVYVRQDDNNYVLRSVPLAAAYLLDIAQFEGELYVAVGSLADGRIYFYRDPLKALGSRPSRLPQPFRVLVVPEARYVSFSANARFIAVQGGSKFAVYDGETGRQFRYDTKLTLEKPQKATWMDGHRLMLVSGNKVAIFDFDGTNMQTLSPALSAYTPFFDRDYKAMFTFAPGKTPEKTVIVRTELKVLSEGQ